MKRGYFVYPVDEWRGIGVVATSAKEAKKIAFKSDELGDVEWIDIRCYWQRDADVSNLSTGVVTNMHTGLIRGLYAFVENFMCDECGANTLVRGYKDRALCDDCIEKEYLKG